MIGDVVMGPGERGAALADNFVDRYGRAKRVIDHHDGDPGGDQGWRDEGKFARGESPPIAAMDEHMHRRMAVGGAAGGKNVEIFLVGRAEPKSEGAVEGIARRRAFPRPTIGELGVLGNPHAEIILGVDGLDGREIAIQHRVLPWLPKKSHSR